MTVKTATTCFKHGIAVSYRGIRYDRINAMVARKYVGSGPEQLTDYYQAELCNVKDNAVIIAAVKDLQFPDVEEKEQEPEEDEEKEETEKDV